MINKAYTNQATKRLIKALAKEQKSVNETYEFKINLFSYIRGNSIKVEEKAFSSEVKIRRVIEKNDFVVTFKAGSYPEVSNPNIKEIQNFFEFQASYNSKNLACIFECSAVEDKFIIYNAVMTSYPIKISRNSNSKKKFEYRGRDNTKVSKELSREINDFLKSVGIDQEFVYNCIELARDKEERLYSDWVTKIYKFLEK